MKNIVAFLNCSVPPHLFFTPNILSIKKTKLIIVEM